MKMGQKALNISAVGQIAVTVKDLEKAVAFYRDVLELPFLFEVPGMAFFDVGNLRLMLGLPEREEFKHPASIIYYRVDDIEAGYKILSARDVHFEHPPRSVHESDGLELWLAFFRDMDGNLLSLMEERQTA